MDPSALVPEGVPLDGPVRYAIAAGVGLAVFAAVMLLRTAMRRLLRNLAERTDNPFDDQAESIIASTRPIFAAALGTWAASQTLDLPATLHVWIDRAALVVALWQIGRWATGLLLYAVDKASQKIDVPMVVPDTPIPEEDRAPAVLRLIVSLAVWSVVLLLALENMGIDVTALVAGLGVGGVAVALAVQNVLGDLFASLSIVLDKPFEVGHFIIVGDKMGTVEHIGLKTTRLRSLSGEQLVFGNEDLLSSRVHNYKRMAERRVVQGFRLAYGTPAEHLEAVGDIVREACEAEETVRFDRAHLKDVTEQGYGFETVWWVHDPDYNVHMDIQQRILLRIVRALEARDVRFALPVRQMVDGAAGFPHA